MICFRDMTFCASNCSNSDCRRHFGKDDQAAADTWWEGFKCEGGPPVAFSDFHANCENYQAPPKETPRRATK